MVRNPDSNINQTLESDIKILPGVPAGLMSEDELINNIESQFLDFSDFSVRKDYMWLYLIHFLHMPPELEISKVEEILNNDPEDDIFQSYLTVTDKITKFFARIGLDLDGCLDYNLDYELLYNLYNTFIINLPKLCAQYLIGLKDPGNTFIGKPSDYDPENFENDVVLTQTMESLEGYNPVEFRRAMEEMKKEVNGTTIVNSNNSLVFKNILLKAFFDEEFSFDDFFNIIRLVDNSENIEVLDELISLGKFNIVYDLFYSKLTEFLSYSSNIDLVEDYYKTITEQRKFSNKLIPASQEALKGTFLNAVYDENCDYCFIRLYQTVYKKNLSAGGVLKAVNEFISPEGKNHKKYTHAALNYKLNDNFIGLNFDGSTNNDVKVENLKTEATSYESPKDRSKSKFDVFALKLTSQEYDALQKSLNVIRTNNKFKYDFKRLLQISGIIIFNKIKDKIFGKESSDDIRVDLTQSNESLVCSTFVAYVLSQISPRYADYFKKKDINIHSITPNDLTFLPGIQYMYGGYWSEYNIKTRDFIRKKPEFQKYLK